MYGKRGAIISAVDLVRGVGVLLGWRRIDVPGATGYLDTDYASKGRTGNATAPAGVGVASVQTWFPGMAHWYVGQVPVHARVTRGVAVTATRRPHTRGPRS